MVRLTAELVMLSPQFTNTLKDRELDLRGRFESGLWVRSCAHVFPLRTIMAVDNGIPAVENLGASLVR